MYHFGRLPAAHQSLVLNAPHEWTCPEFSTYEKFLCAPNMGSDQDLNLPNIVFLHPSVDQPGLQENGCPFAMDRTKIELNAGASRSEELAVEQESAVPEVPQPRPSIMMLLKNVSLSFSYSNLEICELFCRWRRKANPKQSSRKMSGDDALQTELQISR